MTGNVFVQRRADMPCRVKNYKSNYSLFLPRHLSAASMAHVEVDVQEGHVSTGGYNAKRAQIPKQKSSKSESPAPGYFSIGNAIALADDEKDDGSQSLIQRFSRYVLNSGVLLFGIDNADLLERFLGEAAAFSAIEKFVKGDDATFVLEMRSSVNAPGVDDDEDPGAMYAAIDVSFGVSGEIPSSVLDAVSSEFQLSYLLFTKIAEGCLKDEEDIPMASQLTINKFNPAQPFQSMILEKLYEVESKLNESQDEVKLPEVSLEPTSEIRQWLKGLGAAEKKAIILAHTKQRYDVDIPEFLKNNNIVIGKLLKQLRIWKETIGSVARRSGRLHTLQQEIKFLRAKSASLEQVEAQLKSLAVCATTLVLIQNNKRVQAYAFLHGLKLEQAKRDVKRHNEVLSAFPMKELMTSSSVRNIIIAIGDIFRCLKALYESYMKALKDQKKKEKEREKEKEKKEKKDNTEQKSDDREKLKPSYPLERIANLARAAARDVSQQLRKVLSRKVMFMEYSVFVARTTDTERLFHNFESMYTKLRADLRQLDNHKKKSRSLNERWHHARYMNSELKQLQDRVKSIKEIRHGHATLESAINNAITENSMDKSRLQEELDKIIDAYNVFRRLDVLNASTLEWTHCVEEYNCQIEEVENKFQRIIRLAVESANGPSGMFRVCERYSSLFVRERVRKVVWEFQELLIEHVQEEVRQLQNRYISCCPIYRWDLLCFLFLLEFKLLSSGIFGIIAC